MTHPAFCIALAAGLVAAGCLSSGDEAPAPSDGPSPGLEGERLPPPTEDLSTAIVSDHGAPYLHAIQELHQGSYAMELVGYNPITGQGGHPLTEDSAYAAITIHGHIACLSGWAGSGGFGGATLIDVEDPAAPTVLASIPTTSLQARCQFTDDGAFLMLAAYGGATPGTPLPAPLADAGSWGVSFYDVADPAAPRFMFHDATGGDIGDPSNLLGGPYHNVDSETIDGVTYVFQTYTCNVLRLKDDLAGLEIVGKLEHCAHDFWTGIHPVTGVRTLVTGTSSGGTAFIDITDPADPVALGTYEPSDGLEGWHRQWPLAETVDGRALVVVAGEQCGNGKSLPYTVVDWTDPAGAVELGSWQIPGNPEIREPGQLCSMNSHEFNVHDGYVASGNYHAGVWVFDVGTSERAREPVTIGYYEPHEDPRAHGGTRNTPFAWTPDVWGAYFDDRGYVLAADWYSGFYVLGVPGLTDGTSSPGAADP